MPTVIGTKIGDKITVPCCCGMESFLVSFMPGRVYIDCTKKPGFFGAKQIKIEMEIDSNGVPRINQNWV